MKKKQIMSSDTLMELEDIRLSEISQTHKYKYLGADSKKFKFIEAESRGVGRAGLWGKSRDMLVDGQNISVTQEEAAQELLSCLGPQLAAACYRYSVSKNEMITNLV